jgi:1,4-dihydroxy-2-naphthoate octaprenyltransferase
MAALAGAVLVFRAGWPIAGVGVAAIASGLAYTAGPFPLAYVGVADLFVFVFFGPVAVTGTHYVQAVRFSLDALALSIPVGLLTTAILAVNDIRDVSTDGRAGKRTLPVRFGLSFGKGLYVSLVLAAYAWTLALGVFPGRLWRLLPLVSLPWAIRLIRRLCELEPGPEMNPLLVDTARLLLWFSLLLAGSIVLGGGLSSPS